MARNKKKSAKSSTAKLGGSKPPKPNTPKSQMSPLVSPKRRQKQRHDISEFASSPLGTFFANYYPQFIHDPTESASHEFYRLCDESGWDKEDLVRQEAHQNFKDALVKQFNHVYGTNEQDLEEWQNLCYILQIEPVPDGLHACRQAVSGTFVNLVDLVDIGFTHTSVQLFESELELSEYTKERGKFFPRENAYAGGLLRYLLRHILNPAKNVPPRGRRGRKRRS